MAAMAAEPVMDLDLVAGSSWSCVSTPAGARSGPDDLDGADLHWLSVVVPGTVAHALRLLGASEPSRDRLDGQDWWFRARFPGPGQSAQNIGASGGWILTLEGLATVADVWLNGRHLLHSESMFTSWRVPVEEVAEENELCIRFAALTPVLAGRRARPRWKTRGIASQNLRWIRTTLLGRQAGWTVVPVPVGPWRPIHLVPAPSIEVLASTVRTACQPGSDGATVGTISVELDLCGDGIASAGNEIAAALEVEGRSVPLVITSTDSGVHLVGTALIDEVERWWPHTHGPQPLYPVRVVVAGVAIHLGDVGFRTITADRSDGGFQLVVNDIPIFCRGAGWFPLDPVSLQSSDDELTATIELARASGMNMLRIAGGTVYESDRFFTACDRAGLMVWQDAMLGPLDPPDDEGFTASVVAEVADLLDRTSRHPSMAVLCGGQQLEQQPAMFGLPRDRWHSPLIHEALPDLVERRSPGLVYVTSSPSGGDLPFQPGLGVSHYFGVGVYLFPLEDMRRAAPRFVTEGLAFSIPPDRATIDEAFGGDLSVHRESEWKRAVHRDAGSWFDLEDVRDHYVNLIFGADIAALWRTDHDRALDLGRATMAEIMSAAVAEWRRTGSSCDGMLAIALRDLRPGPGWGLIDSSGRPKAPWYALARSAAPVAVLATDEGTNGLALHLVNDLPMDVEATLELGLHTAAHTVERATCPVVVPSRGGITVRAEALFDGFRDLTYAYHFGPRTYDLITADLVDKGGNVLATAGYLPGGPARDMDPDVGLQSEVGPADGLTWPLRVFTHRFAQYIQIDVPGFAASDSWFHLPPGGSRTVLLRAEPGCEHEPKGRLRALNSVAQGSVSR